MRKLNHNHSLKEASLPVPGGCVPLLPSNRLRANKRATWVKSVKIKRFYLNRELFSSRGHGWLTKTGRLSSWVILEQDWLSAFWEEWRTPVYSPVHHEPTSTTLFFVILILSDLGCRLISANVPLGIRAPLVGNSCFKAGKFNTPVQSCKSGQVRA